jgi:NitT/TauT family transport system substrate-binding protein
MNARLKTSLDAAVEKWLGLSPRDRKALELLALLLVFAGLYLAVFSPLIDRYQYISELRDKLEANKRTASEQARLLPQRERKFEKLSAEYNSLASQLHLTDNGYLDQPRILEAVEMLAQFSGVSISQLTPKGKQDRGDHMETLLELSCAGPVAAVKKFVYLLETSEEVFNLTNINVRPDPVGEMLEAKISLVKLSVPQPESRPDHVLQSDILTFGLYPKVSNIPFHIAAEMGWLKGDGCAVVLKNLGNFKAAEMLLLSGDMRAINTSLYSLPFFRNAGLDLRAVLVTDWSAPRLALVVSPSSKIGRVEELEGKTVFIQSAQYHHILFKILEKHGMPLDSVHTENLTQGMLLKALESGLVEVALITLEGPSDRLRTLEIIDVPPEDAVWVVAVGAELLQGRGARLTKLLVEGYEKGLAWWREHPEEGNAIGAKRMNITPQQLQRQLPSIVFPTPPLLQAFLCGTANKEPGVTRNVREIEQFYRVFWKREVNIGVDDIADFRFIKPNTPCQEQ